LIAPSATPQGGRTLGGAALTDITEKRLRPERRTALTVGVGVLVAALLAFLAIGKLTAHDPIAKSAEPPPTSAPAATLPPTAVPTATPPATTGDASTSTAPPTTAVEPPTSATPTATSTRTPGTRRPIGPRQPVTTTVTTPIPSAAHTGDVTTPPKKKTRVLDNENPLATE